MKKLLLVTQILMLTTFADAKVTSKHLSDVAQVYTALSSGEVDLVDQHYWLGFSHSSSDLKSILAQSDFCQQEKNFKLLKDTKKKSAVEKLVGMIGADLMNGLDLAYPENSEYEGDAKFRADIINKKDLALQSLGEALQGSKIELCVDTSAQSYSDGHEATMVKIDGTLSFVYEVGYPD